MTAEMAWVLLAEVERLCGLPADDGIEDADA